MILKSTQLMPTEEFSIAHGLWCLTRWRWLFFGCLVLGTVMGGVLAALPPRYEYSTAIQIGSVVIADGASMRQIPVESAQTMAQKVLAIYAPQEEAERQVRMRALPVSEDLIVLSSRGRLDEQSVHAEAQAKVAAALTKGRGHLGVGQQINSTAIIGFQRSARPITVQPMVMILLGTCAGFFFGVMTTFLAQAMGRAASYESYSP